MKYDIILFDADGTLLDFARSEKEALSDALDQIGMTYDDEVIATYSRMNDELWKRLERGEIEKKVLFYRRFELFFSHYGFEWDAHDMAKRYMYALAQKGYILEGADALCRALYGKVRLYIVTNGVEFIQKGRFAACGLAPYFEDRFISDALGYEKPKTEFFEAVARQIPNFSKERVLIVGDSLTSDMRGGINYGIDTCWYNPTGKSVPMDMEGEITYTAESFGEIEKLILEDVAP
ncbi:MAG: YjjG family noncanonical pyrimidine nucleotidase [Clostridia bacterium]|nr:YjjG family noncanonical pyrimidine nucleotidase [Clostridia bacterium]